MTLQNTETSDSNASHRIDPAQNGSERRTFMKTALTAFGALAGLGLVGETTPTAQAVFPRLRYNADIPGTGDIKVLNYALALEDLEASLYNHALKRLTAGGIDSLSRPITGLGLDYSEPDVAYIRTFRQVEHEHRNFIRATVTSAGGPVIPGFQYDFGIQSMTRQQVLELVYTAEKTGVSAYLGAISLFQTKSYLQIAGAIQGTEARHTAVIAGVLNALFDTNLPVAPSAGTDNGIDQPLTPAQVLTAISPFIVV